jgi:hypothetical protein
LKGECRELVFEEYRLCLVFDIEMHYNISGHVCKPFLYGSLDSLAAETVLALVVCLIIAELGLVLA